MNDTRTGNGTRDRASSTDIKADIAQTRAQMENKFGQLQDMLDPNRLKEQAQDAVRGMVSDSSTAVMDYMRDHKDEIGTSMLDAVKQNPLPAALIGLGLGWLALEAMSPRSARTGDARNWTGSRADMGRHLGDWENSTWRQYDRTPTYGEWQGSNAADREDLGSYGGFAGYAGRSEMGQHPAQDVKDQVADTVKDAAANVKDAAMNAVDTAAEKAGEAVDAVRDAAGQVGDRLRSGAGQVADRARPGAYGNGMGTRGPALGMQAREVGRSLGRQVEDNPMMFGAMAFAVGAAVAMLMPQSRMENRYVGETRDRMLESAKELGQDVTERVQRVVEEVRPELEETAKKVVENVKQVGEEAAQELQGAAAKVQTKAKQEGEGLLSAVESTVDKAAAKLNPPTGWDTLRGRWHQLKGEVKSQWSKLSDDDLAASDGDYAKLVALIQSKYSCSRSQAEQELAAFARSRS